MAKTTRKRRKSAQLGVCPTPDWLWRYYRDTDLPSLLENDPAFVAARTVHEGDPLVRAELEARVLSGQSQVEIATKMGLAVDAVADYEDFWFDVRSRFESTSWICHEAIQLRPDGELLPGDVAPYLRWVGFFLGTQALESFLAAVSAERLRAQGLDAYWRRDSRLDVDLKILLLIQRLPVPKTRMDEICWAHCQEELKSLQVLHTEDLLTPLQLDLAVIEGQELPSQPRESKRGSDDENKVVRLLKSIFDKKSRQVRQTQPV